MRKDKANTEKQATGNGGHNFLLVIEYGNKIRAKTILKSGEGKPDIINPREKHYRRNGGYSNSFRRPTKKKEETASHH